MSDCIIDCLIPGINCISEVEWLSSEWLRHYEGEEGEEVGKWTPVSH